MIIYYYYMAFARICSELNEKWNFAAEPHAKLNNGKEENKNGVDTVEDCCCSMLERKDGVTFVSSKNAAAEAVRARSVYAASEFNLHVQ